MVRTPEIKLQWGVHAYVGLICNIAKLQMKCSQVANKLIIIHGIMQHATILPDTIPCLLCMEAAALDANKWQL